MKFSLVPLALLSLASSASAAACDGAAGVGMLLTPAVLAALIPGSAAPLPKEIIHGYRVRPM